MKISSTNHFLMYYCKNIDIKQNIYKDRIWRAESFCDGKSDFAHHQQIVIQGTSEFEEDDLSCSCGVIINPYNSNWSMYNIAAYRNTPLQLYLHYAISTDG